MPAPMPTPVQSRPRPEESDCVVVGAATTIEGMLAVSKSVLVPDCPVADRIVDDNEVDGDDELDNDELDRLEEADDDPDAD